MRSPISSKIVNTLTFVLLLVVMMAGCSDENGGVLEVCDNTPPLAGTITPGCGATGVPLNQKITATFNEAMDSSTVTTATFTLAGPTGTPVPGTVTYVSATNIATFSPSSNLAAGTTYTYTIKGGASGAKDMGGNGLSNNFACSFTTGEALDGTAPTVASTDPANNATGVPLSKATSTDDAPGGILSKTTGTAGVASGRIITATFNEAMDPLTITSSTFTVTGPGTTVVTGSVSYAGPSFAATFVPANNLAPNTTYTGTITTGAKDLAGNALANNYVWSFTTGATVDGIAPTIVSTDPAPNATGVPLNKKIAATFSETMNLSTMNTTTFTLLQGTTLIPGAVTYSGTTALFSPTTNLAPNTVYTATMNSGARDLAGNALAASFVWTFTTGAVLDVTPPTVVATNPANNATGVPLTKVSSKNHAPGASLSKSIGISVTAVGKVITATFSEGMDPLTITTSTVLVKGPGITPVAGSVTYAGPSFAATFLSVNRLAPNTTYTGTITTGAKDLAGNALAVNYVWTFTTGAAPDTLEPTVVSTDPSNGDIDVALNKKIAATFSEPMILSTINATTFTLQQGTTSILGAVTYTGTTALFTPASILAPNTVYTATMHRGVTDLSGVAMRADYVWNFTTGAGPDITPPTVNLTDPTNNATGVAVNKKVAATFSESMDPTTVNTNTFLLRQGTTPIAGTLTYLGMIAVFTPAANLAPNTIYTATITTGAGDLAGNALVNNYVWNFTTAAALDISPPTVISTDPVNNATGVVLTKKIAATFSEAMDASSLTTASVTVTQLGGAVVAGTVTYAALTNTLTFTPSSPLASNTTFTVTIKGGTTGAKDLAGNALVNNYVWSFRTADATPPTVLLADPLCGATEVSINKKLAVTFSKAMDPATISTTTFTVAGPGGANVTGVVAYAAATNTVTFETNYAALTEYTFTIHSGAAGVKDMAGNSLVADFVCNFTTGSAPDIAPPTILSTDPLHNAAGVPITKIIAVTFSEAMDQSTITALGTFTLMQGLAPVSGSVGYSGTTATFAPGSNLAFNTVYTAKMTTAAEDLSGNPLARDSVWSFTTAVAPIPGILPVNLGSTANFVVLAGSRVTNVPLSNITGDVGLWPAAGSLYAGLTAPEVTGTIYDRDGSGPAGSVNDNLRVQTAQGDLTIAYNDAAGRTPVPSGPRLNPGLIPGSGDIGGMTLAPGLYKFTVTARITVDVTLSGSATDVWIFQMDQDFIVSNSAKVLLGGAALSKNIFWQVGTSAALGTAAVVEGTIMADQSITMATGARLNGRALARIALVSMQQNIIVRPSL